MPGNQAKLTLLGLARLTFALAVGLLIGVHLGSTVGEVEDLDNAVVVQASKSVRSETTVDDDHKENKVDDGDIVDVASSKPGDPFRLFLTYQNSKLHSLDRRALLQPRWPNNAKPKHIRVFVYRGSPYWPVNDDEKVCEKTQDQLKGFLKWYKVSKHSDDYNLGSAFLSDAFRKSDWYTEDPLNATILVVPSPLALITRFCDERAGPQRDLVVKALLAEPHFQRTRHRHLWIAADWKYHLGKDPLWRPVFDNFILGTFEGRGNEGRCVIRPNYVSHDCPLKSDPKAQEGFGKVLNANECTLLNISHAACPLLGSFRGQVDGREAYAFRRKACEMFDAKNESRIVIGCKKLNGFCSEVEDSAFLITIRGDTPTTARFGLMAHFRKPLLHLLQDDEDPNTLIDHLPEYIPWNNMLFFSTLDNLERTLNYLVTSASEDVHIQEKLYNLHRYSGVLDYRFEGGVPAAEFLVAVAINKCLPEEPYIDLS